MNIGLIFANSLLLCFIVCSCLFVPSSFYQNICNWVYGNRSSHTADIIELSFPVFLLFRSTCQWVLNPFHCNCWCKYVPSARVTMVQLWSLGKIFCYLVRFAKSSWSLTKYHPVSHLTTKTSKYDLHTYRLHQCVS